MVNIPNTQISTITDFDFQGKSGDELWSIKFVNHINQAVVGVLSYDGSLKFNDGNTTYDLLVTSGGSVPIALPGEAGTNAGVGKLQPLVANGVLPIESIPSDYVKIFSVMDKADVVNPKNGYIAITPTQSWIFKGHPMFGWLELGGTGGSTALQVSGTGISGIATIDQIVLGSNVSGSVAGNTLTLNVTSPSGSNPEWLDEGSAGVTILNNYPSAGKQTWEIVHTKGRVVQAFVYEDTGTLYSQMYTAVHIPKAFENSKVLVEFPESVTGSGLKIMLQ